MCVVCGEPHKAKIPLQLRRDILCLLSWKCRKVHEASRMVLDHHNPLLHTTINITLPQSTHVNEITLDTVTEMGGNKRRLRPLPHRNRGLLLMANKAIITK